MIEKYTKLIVMILVIIAWSLVGITLWVPLLVRVVFLYTAMVTSSMFSDISLDRSTNALEAASTFYINGFKKIFQSRLSGSSFSNTDTNRSSTDTNRSSRSAYYQTKNFETNKYYPSFLDIIVVAVNIFWSIIFWYTIKIILSGQLQEVLDGIIVTINSIFENFFAKK